MDDVASQKQKSIFRRIVLGPCRYGTLVKIIESVHPFLDKITGCTET
jgi:hypothetical protein